MTRTRTSRPIARGRTGFSLIELLVVIVVIMILVGIGVAVGLKVLGGAQEKDTATTQELLINMIIKYRDLDPNGEPPAKDTRHSLLQTSDTENLVVDLANNPETQKMLMDLPDQAFVILAKDASNNVTDGEFRDAWGNELQYTSNGIGGTPALISAGADGKFGSKVKNETGGDLKLPNGSDDDDPADSEDNIRSDAGM